MYETIKEKGKEKYHEFDSWTSFVDHCALTPTDLATNRDSRDTGKEGWTGTDTYNDAVNLARNGWTKGVEEAKKISGEIEAKLYSLVQYPTVNYDVTGELLDVGRFCSGEPEHWGFWEYNLVEGPGTKHVYIVVNAVASCNVDAKVMMKRGSAVAALINLLELAGHRCKVDVLCAIRGSSFHYEIRTNVKAYDEPLDLDRVTYAVAHPSILRRHVFSAMEVLPDQSEREKLGVSYSYGHPTETRGEKGDVYFPAMSSGDYRWESTESACQWVNEELIRLGIIKNNLEVA